MQYLLTPNSNPIPIRDTEFNGPMVRFTIDGPLPQLPSTGCYLFDTTDPENDVAHAIQPTGVAGIIQNGKNLGNRVEAALIKETIRINLPFESNTPPLPA